MKLKLFNVERETDDPNEISRLKDEGYTPVVKREKPSPAPETPDYSAMLKADLVKLAKEKGIVGAKSMKKDELIKSLG